MTPTGRPSERILELPTVLLIFATVAGVSTLLQAPITVSGGRGWDGTFYYAMAEQMSHGLVPATAAPFVFRVGTPFLAALLAPQHLLHGFLVVNAVGAAIATISLLYWLRLYVADPLIRILLITAFLIQWNAPLRFSFFYPAYTDPWAIVFLIAGLIAVHRLRQHRTAFWLASTCVICFLGAFFREIIGLIGVIALFSDNPVEFDGQMHVRVPRPALFLPLGGALLGIAATHAIVVTTPSGYGFVREAAHAAYDQSLAKYVHAWLLTFGPVLFLLALWWREAGRVLREQQFMLIYLGGIVGLAWIGGMDTERYAIWATPVIGVLLGKVIERNAEVFKSLLFVGFIVAVQVVSARAFLPIPDEWGGRTASMIVLTPIRGASFLNLWTHWAPAAAMAKSMAEYGAIGVFLFLWILYRARRIAATTAEAIGD